jgi:hypothetical protein
MDLEPTLGSSPFLLTFKVPKVNSAVGALVFFMFGILLAIVLGKTGAATSFPGALVWLFTPIPIVGAFYFAKTFLYPPTEFAATQSGVLVFVKNGQIKPEDGVLIPWQSIRAVAYKRFRKGGVGLVSHSLIFSLYNKPPSSNELGIVLREDAVYLEVWSARRGRLLVQQLSDLKTLYATTTDDVAPQPL